MEKLEREKRWAGGDGYNRYITEEFHSFRKNAWKKQLAYHLEPGAGLKILDVGTGPGFFACILSEEGQLVTAIDSSEGMLAHARKNAEKLGVNPEFKKMDVNQLEFSDDTFDALVMRNVTWTLEQPELVYTEFKRILKPGGKLLIYDANWQMHFFDPEKLKRVREREEHHFEKYGTREVVSSGDLEYYATAPLTKIERPAWDMEMLSGRLGMEVSIREDIGREVYEEWEKQLYGESPLFEVCAVKKQADHAQKNMKTYWQKRAETFGFQRTTGKLEEFGTMVSRCLPEGKQKILDVGTGTGVIAASMALLGHEVTAVDLCTHMIEHAEENLSSMGLSAAFVCTPAGELPFPDNTFDVVISRNVTWALPDPEAVLKQWQRVLKPGGYLIYWDANHYYYLFNEEDRINRKKLQELVGTVHGDDAGKQVDYSLCDSTAPELPLSKFDRPAAWDEKVLPRMGFDLIAEEIRRPQNLLKYGIAEGYYTEFFIAAKNGKEAD